ncbi:sugar ABC transporter [Enterobacterales bacterium CwR94]|nr:sugar ABC transporter [Enterobacterales bacterium CwR94]
MRSDPIPRLQLLGLSKAFDGVPALREVSLTLHAGEVLGLIGHNGAGKSTLINILAGIHAADSGEIILDGKPVQVTTPAQAQQHGIVIVHQERLLPPTLTVAEALFLGNEPRYRGTPLINRRKMRRDARALLVRYFDVQLDIDTLVVNLSVAEQQLVQICRALHSEPRILVLDEPTAALARHEVRALFRVIARLRQQGIALIYVSHYLDEIQEICQRVTVLRDGRDVARFDQQTLTSTKLITAMIGNEHPELAASAQRPPGEVVLTLENFSAAGRFYDVNLQARRGEIIGITGLLGSGGKALIRALFGLESQVSGALVLNGKPGIPVSPYAAVKRGVAFVPEDRRANGIALDLSLRENISLTTLHRYLRWGRVALSRERVRVADNIQQLAIRTPGQEAHLRQLSGGNQQKAVLAKWLNTQASIYLLDEPTVGVDIAAKAAIYRTLQQLADSGALVMVFSTDLLELQTLTDRVLVMARGRLATTLTARETNHQEMLAWASGAGPLQEAS